MIVSFSGPVFRDRCALSDNCRVFEHAPISAWVVCNAHESMLPRQRGGAKRERGFNRNLGIDPCKPKLWTRKRSGACLAIYGMWAACPLELSSSEDSGQATKGAWWMPRHQEAMKDVVNCEMPRGAVSRRRSVDIRMGKPGGRNGPSSNGEYIAIRSQPGEVKHLSTRRKRNQPRLR